MSEDVLEPAEADVFGGWVAMGLARDPEGIIARMVQVFPESRLRRAAAVLERTPGTGPEPWPEPDGPGPACNWCGRIAPEGGLTTVYPPPPRPAAWTADPGPGGIPAFRPVYPEPVAEADGDTHPHCRDEAACQRERDSRLPEWRRHQYPGWRPTLRELAALARAKEEARDLLACATAAGYAIRGWLELQDQVSAAEADAVALSGTEDDTVALTGSEPFPWAISAMPDWAHTMRNPVNRSHTFGHQMRQYGHPVPAVKAVEVTNSAMEQTTRAGRRGRPVPPGSTRRRRLSRLR